MRLLGIVPSELYLWLTEYIFDPIHSVIRTLRVMVMGNPWIDRVILSVILIGMGWHYGRRLHELLTRRRLRLVSLAKWPRVYVRHRKGWGRQYILCLKRYDRGRDWKWLRTLEMGFLQGLVQPMGILILMGCFLTWALAWMLPEVADWVAEGYLKKPILIGVIGIILGHRVIADFLAKLVTRRTTWIYMDCERIKVRHSGLSLVRVYYWNPSGYADASMRFRAVVQSQGGSVELYIEDGDGIREIVLCDPVDGVRNRQICYAVQAVLGLIREDVRKRAVDREMRIVDV